jgi:ATP-dependent helicase/nuclease subunit A
MGRRTAAACRRGGPQFSAAHRNRWPRDALRNALENPRGRWLLSPHPEHRCELAVSAILDGEVRHVRIDRTFIEDGVRWIIDYKISPQQGGDRQRFVAMQVEKYRPDIERYARVMRALDLGAGLCRPLRCALYLPLLGEFREVPVDAAGGPFAELRSDP